jgi:hypothetical protein
MRLVIDLVRAADGRLEGVVHTPDVGSTAFDGVLDLLRVLEGIDLHAPGDHGLAERRDDDG